MDLEKKYLHAVKDQLPLSKKILRAGTGTHALGVEDQKLLAQILAEMTDYHPGINLDYRSTVLGSGKPITHGGYFRPLPDPSVTLFLNPKAHGSKHIDDLAFVMAHEAGHAADFHTGKAMGNVDRWAQMGRLEKEYTANEKAMKYLADRDMKVGPRYKELFTDPAFKSKAPPAYHHMPKMAARFGIIPLIAAFLAPTLLAGALDERK